MTLVKHIAPRLWLADSAEIERSTPSWMEHRGVARMERVRVIRLAEGEDGMSWAGQVSAGLWRTQGEILKEDGSRLVARAMILGRDVVIKQWPFGSMKRRAQALCGRTPALRHWSGAQLLAETGVETAPLIALIRGEAHEWLVMEAVEGPSVLECMADESLTNRERHALARSLGRLVATLVLRNIFNRDMKPSNLLVTEMGEDEVRLVVIDCGGVRRQRGGRGRYRMLASLAIEPVGVGLQLESTHIMRCVTAFCDAWLGGVLGREVDRRSQRDRRVRKHVLRATMERVALTFVHHGDLRPLVNPLEPVGQRTPESSQPQPHAARRAKAR